MANKRLWVLVGHWIPNPVQAFAVFSDKPTKQQLFELEEFNIDKELDHFLIDNLLQNGVSGVINSRRDRFEYSLYSVEDGKSLNLNDQLYTGVLDMPCTEPLLICVI